MVAEPPLIFAIFTGYDLDFEYLLKATFIRYCYKQHNTDALKINEYFQPKIRNTGIYIPIIQDKTFNQRKSTCNIRNKCRIIEKHRPNSAPGEKKQ